VYRSPKDDPDGFVTDIKAIAHDRGVGVIIPATDRTMYLVSRNYAALSPHCKPASVDWEQFEAATALDLPQCIAIAQLSNFTSSPFSISHASALRRNDCELQVGLLHKLVPLLGAWPK